MTFHSTRAFERIVLVLALQAGALLAGSRTAAQAPLHFTPPSKSVERAADREPPDTAAAEQELRDLKTALEQWDRGAPDRELLMSVRDIPARLSLFEAHFGVDPTLVAGWNELSQAAAAAYARVEAIERPISDAGLTDGWCGVSWSTMRALLLELTGRGAEAQRILFEPRQDPADLEHFEMTHHICCRMCMFSDSQLEALSRSAALQETGDLPVALRLMHTAALDDTGSWGQGRGSIGIFLARYGLLLASNGHRAEGASLLQHVVELYPYGDNWSLDVIERNDWTRDKIQSWPKPGTTASDIAAAALKRLQLKPEVVGATYFVLDLSEEWPDREAAVFLRWPGADPPLRLLAVRLPSGAPETGEGWWANPARWRTWTLETGFDGAIPGLRALLESDDGHRRTAALAALVGADPSASDEIAPFVHLLLRDKRVPDRDIARCESLLQLLLGGGPAAPRDGSEPTPEQVRSAWRGWLADR